MNSRSNIYELMGIKKNLKKLLSHPVEMRIHEIKNILEYLGYELKFISGSHFHFQKLSRPAIIIPVHNKKVSKHYIKRLATFLKAEFNFSNHEKIQIHYIHLERH